MRRAEILTVVCRTGREAYGQPKKAGQVCPGGRGDLPVGTVARNGIDVATATMCWQQNASSGPNGDRPGPGPGLNVNLRVRQEEEGVISRELVTRHRIVDLTLPPGRIVHRCPGGPA
jgi:hypothetical protein